MELFDPFVTPGNWTELGLVLVPSCGKQAPQDVQDTGAISQAVVGFHEPAQGTAKLFLSHQLAHRLRLLLERGLARLIRGTVIAAAFLP